MYDHLRAIGASVTRADPTQQHALCSADTRSPCYQDAYASAAMRRLLLGEDIGYEPSRESDPDDPAYPLNAACAYCETDASADQVTSRCSGCSLTHCAPELCCATC